MPDQPNGDAPINLPHIHFDQRRERLSYTPVTPPVDPVPLRADYVAHARQLVSQLTAALESAPVRAPGEVTADMTPGALIEMETMPGKKSAKKLPDVDFANQGIRVLQTRRNDDLTERGIVFVPDASRAFLRQRLVDYGAANLGNRPRPHVARFETIETIRSADAASLFVGKEPFDIDTAIWWELWALKPTSRLEGAARRLEIDVHSSGLDFPDVKIVLVHADSARLRRLIEESSGLVAEIRRADLNPEVVLDNGRTVGQSDWVQDVVHRMIGPPDNAPSACMHDTGVASGHPLIWPGLRNAEAYDDRWGTDDHAGQGGHGTGMVSLALFGDLFFPIQQSGPHVLTHWAESVKILPPRGFRSNEPASYGDVTQGAVAKVEIEDPHRPRVHCMAVTAVDFDPASPSSWSGAVDQTCAGSASGDVDRPRRLFLVASGNASDTGQLADVMAIKGIEDPAQSWNAVTIGGYTTKDVVEAPSRRPFGRTSEALMVEAAWASTSPSCHSSRKSCSRPAIWPSIPRATAGRMMPCP